MASSFTVTPSETTPTLLFTADRGGATLSIYVEGAVYLGGPTVSTAFLFGGPEPGSGASSAPFYQLPLGPRESLYGLAAVPSVIHVLVTSD